MSQDIAIDTFIDLLKQGKNVVHTAQGYSMFPSLLPEDKVLVKPLISILPEPGTVIIATKDNNLVLHRLVEIKQDGFGNMFLITRGDSMANEDLPWNPDELIGVAASFTRKGKNRIIKTRLFSKSRYFINRWLLWGWVKFENLKM
jgi:hypothetical protein